MERRACVDHLVYIVFVAAGMKYLLPAACRRFQQRRMVKDVRSASFPKRICYGERQTSGRLEKLLHVTVCPQVAVLASKHLGRYLGR